MTPEWMLICEGTQLVVSMTSFVLSLLLVREEWRTWTDAKWKDTNAPIERRLTPEASLIARERLITAACLLWITFFLAISGTYAVLLVKSTSWTAQLFGQAWLQEQALMLRIAWRTSVLVFVSVRLRTRARIRRELKLDES